MKKIYISGPMTGLPDCNRPAFNALAEKLSGEGHTVLNPAILPDGLSQSEYMDICISMLKCADEIVMLPGYAYSLGAQAEIYLAQKLGITCCFQPEVMSEASTSGQTEDSFSYSHPYAQRLLNLSNLASLLARKVEMAGGTLTAAIGEDPAENLAIHKSMCVLVNYLTERGFFDEFSVA